MHSSEKYTEDSKVTKFIRSYFRDKNIPTHYISELTIKSLVMLWSINNQMRFVIKTVHDFEGGLLDSRNDPVRKKRERSLPLVGPLKHFNLA